MVGFAMGDQATGELWVIAVLASHVCRGIGSQLLARVEHWLFGAGCPELWLITSIDPQRRACGFYRKRGWHDWKIEAGVRYMRKTGG